MRNIIRKILDIVILTLILCVLLGLYHYSEAFVANEGLVIKEDTGYDKAEYNNDDPNTEIWKESNKTLKKGTIVTFFKYENVNVAGDSQKSIVLYLGNKIRVNTSMLETSGGTSSSGASSDTTLVEEQQEKRKFYEKYINEDFTSETVYGEDKLRNIQAELNNLFKDPNDEMGKRIQQKLTDAANARKLELDNSGRILGNSNTQGGVGTVSENDVDGANEKNKEEELRKQQEEKAKATIYKSPKLSSEGRTAASNLDDVVGDADSFVDSANDSENKPGVVNQSALAEFSSIFSSILLYIGTAVFVIISAILGVKFITSSAEGKADIKKLMVPYLFGAVAIFGAFAIWKIAINFLGSI